MTIDERIEKNRQELNDTEYDQACLRIKQRRLLAELRRLESEERELYRQPASRLF